MLFTHRPLGPEALSALLHRSLPYRFRDVSAQRSLSCEVRATEPNAVTKEKPVAHPGSLAYIPRSFRRKRGKLSQFRVPGPDAICLEGTAIEILKEAKLFRVELVNGHRL